MHINKIRLVNFRGMEDLTVAFAPGVNVIIGDNGAGKTSLLNGICVALGGLFDPIHLYNLNASRQIQDDDVRITSTLVGDTTKNTISHFPVRVEADLMLFSDQEIYEVIKENASYSPRMLNENLKNKIREALDNPAIQLPLLNFQSTMRGSIPATDNENPPKRKAPERKDGYKDAFVGTSNFSEIFEWCEKMDYNEYKLKSEVREYKNFKVIISKFMQAITGSKEMPRVEYASTLGQLVFYDGQGGEPLNILSAGYQNLLCMIMDLARRAVLLNPTLENFEKLEGVVIIDEIDMHLHPKWQWKILDALHMTFPSVQFIVATHSPVIISSAKDAKLIKIESPNKVNDTLDAYGNNVSDVLACTQESTEMPEEVKKWRHEIEQALDENDLPKAEGIIQASAEKLGESSSTVQSMRNFLELNKWIVDD